MNTKWPKFNMKWNVAAITDSQVAKSMYPNEKINFNGDSTCLENLSAYVNQNVSEIL